MPSWPPELSIRRRGCRLGGALFAVLLILAGAPAEAAVSEHWYLFRARSNMKIGNYNAAIEAYRKVLENEPDHEEALRGLGAACEANGQVDEAIAAYDRYLSRHRNPDIAFRQARFLSWSRYAYRRADAAKYLRMGLSERDDPDQRTALARLLAADKSTLEEALGEYRKLIRARPDDAALRAEYLKVLLWDDRHLDEAIDEVGRLKGASPNNQALALEHARLLARHPKRLDEAAEAYRALVEAAPANRSLRLEYAKALARDPRRGRQAREQLDLVGRGDFATRLLYADLLASEPAERPEALRRYRELIDEAPKNTAVRLRYARLLGAEKESSGEAIRQYERVLASEPRNGAAHAGLARMYAWSGDSDRALYHDRLALAHGARGEDVRQLQRELVSGREPRVGGGLEAIIQPGTDFGLFGFRIPLHARVDVSPFSTFAAQAGLESFWGGTGESGVGALLEAGLELRVSRDQTLAFELGYQTVRGGAEGLRGRAWFERRAGALSLRPHLDRRPREDSFHSLVGSAFSGAASVNLAGVRIGTQGDALQAWVDPYLGFVSSRQTLANFLTGVDGGLAIRAIHTAAWSLSAGLDLQLMHHGYDASAQDAGGYFSPALFAVATPIATLGYRTERTLSLEVSLGPSGQYQALHGGAAGFVPGGRARAFLRVQPADRFDLRFGASVMRMGDAYLRADASAQASYLF